MPPAESSFDEVEVLERQARVLQRLRSTQPIIDQWRASLDSAVSISRISPFLRRHGPELDWLGTRTSHILKRAMFGRATRRRERRIDNEGSRAR